VTAVGDVKETAEEVHDSDGFDKAIRAGFVVYGVIHLMLAWLALQVAFGHSSKAASSTGALQALAHQPLGGFLIWVIAIGMFVLALWRLLEAWVGHDYYDGGKKARKKAVSLLKAILYGYIGYSAITVATGSQSGGGSQSTTAQLLNMTGGQLIVGAIGLAIIGYGGNLAHRGWSEKFLEHLDAEGKSGEAGKAYTWVGKIGHIAKGIALALVGGLFCYAALTHDAKKSGGLDQALQKVVQQPFGQVLLAAIAVGIACYGLFCFARARHLSRSA
jgi:hypothetical protein